MSDGLLVGRFQPFHLGHLAAVKYALERVKRLSICIGSAEKSHQSENPFTAGERLAMIRDALLEEGLEPSLFLLVPVPDSPSHELWVSLVRMYLPPFDLVFSNDPLTRRLFQEKGFKVVEVPLVERGSYSGTEIRRRIARGEEWRSLVPKAVARWIDTIQGEERIRELTGGKL